MTLLSGLGSGGSLLIGDENSDDDNDDYTIYLNCIQLFDGFQSMYEMLASASAYCLPLDSTGKIMMSYY